MKTNAAQASGQQDAQARKHRKPGAGVKADDGIVGGERKQVRLDEATICALNHVGGGNLSLGIREAARRLSEHNDTGPFDEARHEARKK